MSFYPIFVQLEGKKVVVVGGGNVAHRKVLALLECGASINLAGRELVTELEQMVEKKEIHFLGREFEDEFLNNAFMIIAATDDKDLNHQISTCAREKGVLVNAVDQPPDCDFIRALHSQAGGSSDRYFHFRKKPRAGQENSERS